MPKRQPWYSVARELVECAMGRMPADLVIRNGQWVCVQSGEIVPATDIAIKGSRIAYVGPDASHTIGPDTTIVAANGRYLVPGLLDAHMHVESGMITVSEFVRAVAARGTTGLFIDPHEIANIFGLRGVKLMAEEAALQPINVWVQMPSCVPSAPGLEHAGASLGPDDVREAMQWPNIIGLGEMMNFPGVFSSDPNMLGEMAETMRVGKVVGGHYASPDLGIPFHGYAASGAQDDHEGTRVEDAIARVRQGMKAMLRLGSAWHDVEAQAKAITEMGLDSRHFLLCTDDSHSGTLVNDGHMDRVLRHTIGLGVNPITAIQMMTLNTAEHFGVSGDMGQIAPGRYADIVLASDLQHFRAELVLAAGEVIAENGTLLIEAPHFDYPDDVRRSVRVGRIVTREDFELRIENSEFKIQKPEFRSQKLEADIADNDGQAAAGEPQIANHPTPKLQTSVTANVIGIVENHAQTRHLQKRLPVHDGQVSGNITEDICKIALIERHRGTSKVQLGFVHGFGFNVPCAVASTVAHDSHHMIVVGTDDAHMAMAANAIAQCGGGLLVAHSGKTRAKVEMPIAGLMSDKPAEQVALAVEALLAEMRACGCHLNNANMQLSLLALVVIPELRISDMGLVDVTQFKLIDVIEEN